MTKFSLPRRTSLKLMGAAALTTSALSTRSLHAATKEADVIIVGAGLSGLIAACILEEQGSLSSWSKLKIVSVGAATP